MDTKTTNNILVGLLLFTFGLTITTAVHADKQGALSTPKVPFKHALGMKKYQKNCSSCHGKWIEGTKNGPPLLHGFYKPSHHNDRAFYRAVLKGIFEHHWKFGAMPRIEGITVKDMDKIVPFLRWLQQEKGLY
jgi:hypothetical protein